MPLRSFFFWFVTLVSLTACTNDDATQKKFQGDMVLALSWQPAFCETRPRLRECRSQKPGRYDVNNFSLHGLWPQPGSNVYCDVNRRVIETDKRRRWKKLKGLGLSDSLKTKLWKIMPGARSFLHRHEWIKHGTCYSDTPETYYLDSVFLTDTINRSPVRDLFARNIGKRINNTQIRTAFEQTFGQGAGQRVRVACKRDGNRTLITEITIGLSGLIHQQADLAQLIQNAPATKKGCIAGFVDPVGFQ